jgi:hypothetical protein
MLMRADTPEQLVKDPKAVASTAENRELIKGS